MTSTESISALEVGDSNPYAVLGLSAEATPAEIRSRYFALVRVHSPERDPEGFKRVRAAYEQLRSPRKRAELTLLELRQEDGEFDLDRLQDAPLPPLPGRWLDHLVAVALAALDQEIDVQVAQKRATLLAKYRSSEGAAR